MTVVISRIALLIRNYAREAEAAGKKLIVHGIAADKIAAHQTTIDGRAKAISQCLEAITGKALLEVQKPNPGSSQADIAATLNMITEQIECRLLNAGIDEKPCFVIAGYEKLQDQILHIPQEEVGKEIIEATSRLHELKKRAHIVYANANESWEKESADATSISKDKPTPTSPSAEIASFKVGGIEYSIPKRIKDQVAKFCFEKELNLKPLYSYLLELSILAPTRLKRSQENPLEVVEEIGVHPESIDDIAEQSNRVSNFADQLEQHYGSAEGIRAWKDDLRRKCIEKYGAEDFRTFEELIGVDSRGLDVGDPKPFLGVNLEVLRATGAYTEALARLYYHHH